MQLRAAGDELAQDGHRRGVPHRRQPVESQRVEVVAGEERKIRIVPGQQPRLPVMEQVALPNRLHHELMLID
jgi:hypothetical protein